MTEDNPFLRYNPTIGRKVGACCVADRLDEVRRAINPTWLKAVISHPDMQSSVVKAAQVRLRKLGGAAA